tara:strand:+ start:2421 stop:3251 length:831 start_codon:yes stop_codon:yes gene_type:complete
MNIFNNIYLIIAINVLLFSCSDNKELIKLKSEAENLYENKKIELAIQKYNEVLGIDSTEYDALAQRGLLKFETGDIKGALEDINSAIELKNAGIYFYHKARFIEENGLKDSAIFYYSKAISIDSNLYEAYNNRGLLFKADNQSELALRDFNQAISLDPENPILYNNRGTLFQEIDNQEEALNDFSIAINYGKYNNVELSYFYRSRAASYAFLSKYEKAFKDLNKALELNSSNSLALLDRGILNKLNGDKKEACSDWKKAEELGNSEARYYINKFCL